VSEFDPTAIVLLGLLIVGGLAVYIAYRDPRMGTAILVGAGVVGLLLALVRKNRTK
jgi:threonine dehydrogenase-like Zn-dependent dehydrogenase